MGSSNSSNHTDSDVRAMAYDLPCEDLSMVEP